MSATASVPRLVSDLIVDKLTGVSTQYYLQSGNIRDLNIMRTRVQQQWDGLLAIAESESIDPRWANIDFDQVNAEMRELRDQIARLQAHINTTQPIQANADGYVEEPQP